MKKTGVRKYLSGSVEISEADYILNDRGTGQPKAFFQNIMTDERKGYAYKVTFASIFPNFGGYLAQPFAIQTFSRRELLRFTDATANIHAGVQDGTLNIPSLAGDNRTIGMVGGNNQASAYYNYAWANFQSQYVVKGDALVTESISLCVNVEFNESVTGYATGYYIELEEYEITDNENILLILNEKSQSTSNRSELR